VAIANIDTRKLDPPAAQQGCAERLHRRPGRRRGRDCRRIDKAVAAAQGCAQHGGAGPGQSGVSTQALRLDETEWQLGTGYGTQDAPRFHVVAYDFGVKKNILRMLAERGCKVTVVPAQTPAAEVLALKPDGVFLSNGPGDPEPCDYAIAATAELIETGMPTFGICLGHQIMALASGAKTFKMKFGHHGANHPVKDLDTGRVSITSQNHGFAVDEKTLPANLRATHISLFDGTLQGLARTDKPAFCFQGHPEASPGPHDIAYLFDRFIALMEKE
jgi:carbamoyl-phosphate synthase small subunit